MATAYIISATSLRPARTMANKKSAVTEADARAREVKFFEAVTITTEATGKEVYRTDVIKPEPAPAPQPVKAKAPRKAAKRFDEPTVKRGQLRPALGSAPRVGWEVLYDKPVKGYQIWRGDDLHTWGLYCIKHDELTGFDTMKDARTGVKDGNWCDACTEAVTETEMIENEVQDDLDGGDITEDDLELLRKIKHDGIVNGAWNPNTAAEGQTLEDMRRLESMGLVELVINDPDNIWVYVPDKGELALELAAAAV